MRALYDKVHRMSQLGALVWLKWRLFRNSLRTGKAVTTRLASALAMLAALGFSLLVGFGLGSAAYFFASPHAQENAELSKFAGGAGLALRGVGRALVLAALAVVFGVALSKLFSSFMGALLRQRRTRGETVLALLG